MPKRLRDKLGIKPGKMLSVELVNDHLEIRPLPDDPIEALTGIFETHPHSLAKELLDERKKDNQTDEKDPL